MFDRFSVRKRFLFVGAVLATVALSVPTALAATSQPTLKLTLLDDVVVASAKHFDANDKLDIVATVEGGTGTTSVTADAKGSALVGFSLPESFKGVVKVAAQGKSASASSSITVGAGTGQSTTQPVVDNSKGNTPTDTGSKPSTGTPSTGTPSTGTPSTGTPSGPQSGVPTGVSNGSLPSTIKIMAIGDSITQGGGQDISTGSYRKPLLPRLQAIQGTKWDFVGSQVDGPTGLTADPQHEGYSGKRNDDIATLAQPAVKSMQPDVVLIHGGTNDILQGQSGAVAADHLRTLIKMVHDNAPKAHIVVAGITPIYTTDAQVKAMADYQKLIPQVVDSFKTSGADIAYVDIFSTLTRADIKTDGVHMLDSGNEKIANGFYSSLTTWLQGYK